MKRKTERATSPARMTAADLPRTTAEFDREDVAGTFSPLTPADRERWERARRKPGRPRQGRGARVISVSVERDLLARADALAEEMGITRARLIARGLQAVLAAEGHTPWARQSAISSPSVGGFRRRA
jgi:hypothetical protein